MKGWNSFDVFKEKESSKKERPIFEELKRRAKSGHYAYILVFRLDRAWRSSRQFIMDFGMLQDRGINLVSVTEGLDPTTPAGKAYMTIIMALNELERENISIATKERLDSIKELNEKNKLEGKEEFKHMGRPKGSHDKNQRSSDGYKARWSKLKGDKQVVKIKPETIDIKM
jgi:DNA invertase Pin-like site-specific DNA recombinase